MARKLIRALLVFALLAAVLSVSAVSYTVPAAIQLTRNSFADTEPRVSGQNAVWSGDDGFGPKLFLYDGLRTTRILLTLRS